MGDINSPAEQCNAIIDYPSFGRTPGGIAKTTIVDGQYMDFIRGT
jgi:hypothetical protein